MCSHRHTTPAVFRVDFTFLLCAGEGKWTMAKSFAQYALQFLLQQNNPESSLSSSQLLFFSLTTDEGSQAGNNHDTDLDDGDDPHLRESHSIRASRIGGGRTRRTSQVEDEDPYLRLDEDDFPPGASRHAAQSIPLMSLNYDQAEAQDFPKGWLAHKASPP